MSAESWIWAAFEARSPFGCSLSPPYRYCTTTVAMIAMKSTANPKPRRNLMNGSVNV
ncbi:unannotated protein [freshwater metagenome]|uniref:Unannotated protein n=1 Tax=freshwater metagenome TaxID=449393 RepID=A0A6J6TNH4_9ZZZZ